MTVFAKSTVTQFHSQKPHLYHTSFSWFDSMSTSTGLFYAKNQSFFFYKQSYGFMKLFLFNNNHL